jgi:hypothetical protein
MLRRESRTAFCAALLPPLLVVSVDAALHLAHSK